MARYILLLKVSIHTPTWGVTHAYTEPIPVTQFQSTHLHEVWLFLVGPLLYVLMFQSTHLHEVWRVNEYSPDKVVIVSIHTPTWGVTIMLVVVRLIWMFQSTHLHEVWPCKICFRFAKLSFNPHTYMRCDTREDYIKLCKKVSIHTPTWGVTFIFILLI